MRPGDVVATKHFTAHGGSGKFRGEFGFKAPKGGFLVFQFLGVEKPGETLDVIAMLYDLGWSSPEFPDPRVLAPSDPGEPKK